MSPTCAARPALLRCRHVTLTLNARDLKLCKCHRDGNSETSYRHIFQCQLMFDRISPASQHIKYTTIRSKLRPGSTFYQGNGCTMSRNLTNGRGNIPGPTCSLVLPLARQSRSACMYSMRTSSTLKSIKLFRVLICAT